MKVSRTLPEASGVRGPVVNVYVPGPMGATAVPLTFLRAMLADTAVALALSLQAPRAWNALQEEGMLLNRNALTVPPTRVPSMVQIAGASTPAMPSAGVKADPPSVPVG